MGMTLPPFPAPVRPRSAADGRQVARLALAELGLQPVGLRLAPAPAELPGAARSPWLAGPLLDGRIHPDGTTLAAAALRVRTVSAAMVLVLARPLLARARPWRAAEILARAAAIHPALDVAESRFTPGHAPDLAGHIADLSGLGAVVVGRRAKAVPEIARLAAMPIAIEPAGAGGIGRPGRPGRPDIAALLAAAAAAAVRAGGLPAGAAILLAGLTPPRRAAADATIAARFPGLGRVALRFVA